MANQLNQVWPAIPNSAIPSEPTNQKLWENEWTMYGTCCSSVAAISTLPTYFSTGLAYNTKYDVQGTLSKAAIVPDASKRYKVSQIASTLSGAFTVTPWIGCQGSTTDTQSLSQIIFCFDTSMNSISCTSQMVVDDVTDFTTCDPNKQVFIFITISFLKLIFFYFLNFF